MQNINAVIITGNLTRDPELRHLGSGTAVCGLRVAVNERRKDQSGEYYDRPNYLDVTVWGARGEACAEHLAKGRGVAVDGRLEWREWETKDGGKRQAVQIVADSVQFLPSAKRSEQDEAEAEQPVEDRFDPETPEAGGEPALAGVGGGEEEIPF